MAVMLNAPLFGVVDCADATALAVLVPLCADGAGGGVPRRFNLSVKELDPNTLLRLTVTVTAESTGPLSAEPVASNVLGVALPAVHTQTKTCLCVCVCVGVWVYRHIAYLSGILIRQEDR